MKQVHQVVLIGSVLLGSWLGMMAAHESGHVLAAWLSGGRVTKVVVHPLTISRTDVSPNPNPRLVAWSGPLVGILLPLLVWVGFRRFRLPGEFVARFFAGFCLIANGAYLACG